MTQINPISFNDAEGQAKDLLAGIKTQMGSIPNIFATMAHAPKVLEGFLSFSSALGQGHLDAGLREQIALTVAGRNSCDYCASAHTLMAKGAGVSDEEAKLSLHGKATDSRNQVALDFASELVDQRGNITAEDLDQVRAAGFSEGEIIEILAAVAINIFTNYFNHVAGTEIDFPLVTTEGVSAAA